MHEVVKDLKDIKKLALAPEGNPLKALVEQMERMNKTLLLIQEDIETLKTRISGEPVIEKKSVRLRNAIMDIMSDGASRHIHEIYNQVRARGDGNDEVAENYVGVACSKLYDTGKLARLRHGIYQLKPEANEQA